MVNKPRILFSCLGKDEIKLTSPVWHNLPKLGKGRLGPPSSPSAHYESQMRLLSDAISPFGARSFPLLVRDRFPFWWKQTRAKGRNRLEKGHLREKVPRPSNIFYLVYLHPDCSLPPSSSAFSLLLDFSFFPVQSIDFSLLSAVYCLCLQFI